MKVEHPNVAVTECSTGRAGTIVLVCCIFVLYSFCRVPIPGVNEPHYLCKARAFYDSQWCAGDHFLRSANAHFVFFALFGAAAQILPLTAVAVFGRVLCLTLFGFAWTALGRRLCLSSFAILVAACSFCVVAMSGNFSGEWVIGGLEGKVPAYGVALLSVSFWLDGLQAGSRRRYVMSGVCAGMSVSFHPVVGLWFCIDIALSELGLRLCRRTATDGVPGRTNREWLQDVLAFAATAFVVSLPGLIPALALMTSENVSAAEIAKANRIQVFWRLAHHLDPVTFPVKAWVHTAVLGSACIVGYVGLRRWQPESMRLVVWRPYLHLLSAAAVLATAGVVVGWHSGPASDIPDWEWRAAVLKFYPFRLFDALLPVTMALIFGAMADIVVHMLADKKDTGDSSSAATVNQGLRRAAGTTTGRGAIVCMCVCLVIVLALWQRPTAPGGYSRKYIADWKCACDWIRRNTPWDSRVFTPRESFAFKWFAERAEYVCIKDCPQDAVGILEWNQRLWNIYDWSSESFQDGRFDDTDLERLRILAGCSYVLTRRLGPFESEPVFRNDTWRVYAIPDVSSRLK